MLGQYIPCVFYTLQRKFIFGSIWQNYMHEGLGTTLLRERVGTGNRNDKFLTNILIDISQISIEIV